MSQVINYLVLILLCLRQSIQHLTCLTVCPTIQVKYSEVFIEPSYHDSCTSQSPQRICKGRLIAYYSGKSVAKYINYTFGPLGDPQETRYETDIDSFGLRNLKKYTVQVNATIQEATIQVDIYCTTASECALSEIKKLFNQYRNQLNPFYDLEPLVYASPTPTELHCFNRLTQKSEKCTVTNGSSVCLSDLRALRDECSISRDVFILEEFIITSPEFFQIRGNNQLVKCNKDNCNTLDMLTKVGAIVREYANGTVTVKSNGQQRQTQINRIVYTLSSMLFFIVFTFY